MADHTIRAELLSDGRVSIPPATPSGNPLEVSPNDTVEWSFVDAQGQPVRDGGIQFVGFLPTNPASAISSAGRHPFDGTNPPTLGARFTVATNAERGLYLYKLTRAGQVLLWNVPLFTVGSFKAFFAGIIVRDPPGGGSGR